MVEQIKRAHSRRKYEAAIRYGNFNADVYFDARTYNSSMDGMYFESVHGPRPKSDIYIQMLNYTPEGEGPEAYRFYRAKVKWCKQIVDPRGSSYGVGVQYIARSRIASGAAYTCSLCGDNIPYGKFHQTEDFVYWCQGCFKHFDSLPEGKVKESIKNFLIGNVI